MIDNDSVKLGKNPNASEVSRTYDLPVATRLRAQPLKWNQNDI